MTVMTDDQKRRIWEIENSCDGRTELAERIVALEDEAKRLQTCVLVLDSELADWKGQYDPTDVYVRKAQEENEKLREELSKARDPQRIGGQADPSSFVYAIEQLREFRWQHATNDEDAIPYINNVAAAHERENAKLRELVSQMYRDMQDVLDMSTDTVFVDSISTLRDMMDLHMQAMAELGMPPMDYEDRMRELGMEVD